MSMEAHAEHHSIKVGQNEIEFRLKHSSRKTLGITVKPDARVFVTAPKGAAVEVIKSKVRRRALWIRRQQRFFHTFLPPVPARRYVSGETHRYLGRQYRIKVIEGDEESTKLKGRFIYVHVKDRNDDRRIKALLEGWYLAHAQKVFERSLLACQKDFNGLLMQKVRFSLRRMQTRWGSCTKGGLILLNPELIKAPLPCIDYVVTHEICHVLHPNHGKEFYRLLCRLMPDWEMRKERLEMTLTA